MGLGGGVVGGGNLPRIKGFPVDKRGVVVVADVVSVLALPHAHRRDEVSVHDDISEHRARVPLGGTTPRSDEQKAKETGQHPGRVTLERRAGIAGARLLEMNAVLLGGAADVAAQLDGGV